MCHNAQRLWASQKANLSHNLLPTGDIDGAAFSINEKESSKRHFQNS